MRLVFPTAEESILLFKSLDKKKTRWREKSGEGNNGVSIWTMRCD